MLLSLRPYQIFFGGQFENQEFNLTNENKHEFFYLAKNGMYVKCLEIRFQEI